MRSRAKYHPHVQVGVGSGGAQHDELSGGSVSRGDKFFNRMESRQLFAESGMKFVCSVTGVHTKVAIHHIDGNTSNMSLENLLPLSTPVHAAFHASAATGIALRRGDTLAQAFDAMYPGVIARHVAELKSRKISGTPSDGQSDLKATSNAVSRGND